MGLVLTTIAGLCLWIVLWAIGIKSFDAFLLTLGMIILAVTARMILPALPGSRRDPDGPA
jgi:Mn2+/Fe2+ NRAMP family transporter